jgi:hypothetical protein
MRPYKVLVVVVIIAQRNTHVHSASHNVFTIETWTLWFFLAANWIYFCFASLSCLYVCVRSLSCGAVPVPLRVYTVHPSAHMLPKLPPKLKHTPITIT